MPALQITTSLLGLGLAVLILVLLRRDHLYIRHALFWIVVAVVAAILGIWPRLIDLLSTTVGISYPPAALLLLACLVLFIKALYSDMHHTRLERDQRRLNQRLAMLELQLQEQGMGSLNNMAPGTTPDHKAQS